MSYTLHQLRVFEAVARAGGITKAAQELHMTQPAVSIQIKQLEQHLGMELTEVIGRRTHLTEAGREVYARVQDLGRLLEDMQTTLDEMKGSLRGTLQVAVVSTGKYFMPYFLGRFKELYPGIDIRMQFANRDTVFRHLQDNSADFVVASIPPKDLAVERVPIMDNPLVLAAPPGVVYPKDTIPIKQLAQETFILREEGSGTRLVMQDLFRRHRIQPEIPFELGTSEAVKQAVMAGLGISMLSLFSLKSELKNGEIQILPVEGFPMMTQWQLIWPKGKRFSPPARNFLSFLRDRKQEVMDRHFRWVFDQIAPQPSGSTPS